MLHIGRGCLERGSLRAGPRGWLRRSGAVRRPSFEAANLKRSLGARLAWQKRPVANRRVSRPSRCSIEPVRWVTGPRHPQAAASLAVNIMGAATVGPFEDPDPFLEKRPCHSFETGGDVSTRSLCVSPASRRARVPHHLVTGLSGPGPRAGPQPVWQPREFAWPLRPTYWCVSILGHRMTMPCGLASGGSAFSPGARNDREGQTHQVAAAVLVTSAVALGATLLNT